MNDVRVISPRAPDVSVSGEFRYLHPCYTLSQATTLNRLMNCHQGLSLVLLSTRCLMCINSKFPNPGGSGGETTKRSLMDSILASEVFRYICPTQNLLPRCCFSCFMLAAKQQFDHFTRLGQTSAPQTSVLATGDATWRVQGKGT